MFTHGRFIFLELQWFKMNVMISQLKISNVYDVDFCFYLFYSIINRFSLDLGLSVGQNPKFEDTSDSAATASSNHLQYRTSTLFLAHSYCAGICFVQTHRLGVAWSSSQSLTLPSVFIRSWRESLCGNISPKSTAGVAATNSDHNLLTFSEFYL